MNYTQSTVPTPMTGTPSLESMRVGAWTRLALSGDRERNRRVSTLLDEYRAAGRDPRVPFRHAMHSLRQRHAAGASQVVTSHPTPTIDTPTAAAMAALAQGTITEVV